MGIVMKKHYKAANLPEDLRKGIPMDALVSVRVEEEPEKPLSREELLALMQEAQANAPGTSVEQGVARIRKLRDEWD